MEQKNWKKHEFVKCKKKNYNHPCVNHHSNAIIQVVYDIGYDGNGGKKICLFIEAHFMSFYYDFSTIS